jgi:hypothetical protein
VTQVVEAVHLVELRGLQGLAVAAQDRGLVELVACVRVGEDEVVVSLPARRLEEPIEFTRDGVGERDAACRPLRLGRAELPEHEVLPDADARGWPVDIAPAQLDELALTEPSHRRGEVQRAVDRLILPRLRRGGECGHRVDVEEVNLLAALGSGQVDVTRDVDGDPALTLGEVQERPRKTKRP